MLGGGGSMWGVSQSNGSLVVAASSCLELAKSPKPASVFKKIRIRITSRSIKENTHQHDYPRAVAVFERQLLVEV
jgi:hypothetical protein